VTFILYFLAMGLVLEEFGVNLKGYLASASIVGLAISFGSQGLVQDVVISLTLIFSDAMDAGDMVEIAGTVVVIGRVEAIGLRFTTLRNLYNQIVFIPNRTIANVSRFPHGGMLAYADIQIPPGADQAKAVQTVSNIALGLWAQFGAIIMAEPGIDPLEAVPGDNWQFLRVHFKIWPGQGSLIEFRRSPLQGIATVIHFETQSVQGLFQRHRIRSRFRGQILDARQTIAGQIVRQRHLHIAEVGQVRQKGVGGFMVLPANELETRADVLPTRLVLAAQAVV
jgi:small conductance mechanosensitive channel